VKKLFSIFVFLLIVMAVLVGGKNIIIKFIVENGVKVATGLPLKIEKLNIGIISTQVGIKGLSLLNPKGFPKEAMFYSPEIYVDYNLGDMIKGKLHLEEVRLDIDRFVIVKNAQGQINLDVLKPKEKESKTADQHDKKKKTPQIQIDHLSLKVGKVIYKDYSKGGKLVIKEYNINISEELTDVTSVKVLLGSIATKALAKTAIKSLFNFNKDLLKNTSAVPGQVVDTLKSTADTLKDKIKLPFGGN